MVISRIRMPITTKSSGMKSIAKRKVISNFVLKKTGFHVVTGQKFEILQDGKIADFHVFPSKRKSMWLTVCDVISGQETTSFD